MSLVSSRKVRTDVGKRKEKKKAKKGKFFLMEGHKLNEATGKMEPIKKKVYWEHKDG